MLEISSSNSEINKLADFVSEMHQATECTKEGCDISLFLNPFKEVLNSNKDYTYQERKFHLSIRAVSCSLWLCVSSMLRFYGCSGSCEVTYFSNELHQYLNSLEDNTLRMSTGKSF